MDKSKLVEIAQSALKDHLSRPGAILYSSHETLKPSDIYLLGFNPGGSGGPPLSDCLPKLLTDTSNSYLDEEWQNGLGENQAGKALLQRRVSWLLKKLGYEVRDVCASNLIFFQSRDANGIDYDLANSCWEVHEAILDIVTPKVILVFGNSASKSPYAYIKSKYVVESEDSMLAGHGDWRVKGFQTEINGRQTYVCGLPHLSWYTPEGKDKVIAWLKSKCS